MDLRVIVCPHCGGLNRAPMEKLANGQKPDCGKCHRPLFTGEPVDIESAAAFDRMIGRTEVPVVVDFWAEWCGPCRAMSPQYAAAARQVEPRARFAKLDTEALPDVSARFGIRGIPTMILFSGGREIGRKSGSQDARSIVDFVSAHAS